MLTEAEVIARVEARHQFSTPVKDKIRPDRISVERYGEHASYVAHGMRVWGFVDAAGCERFAIDYARHMIVLNARPRHRS